MQYKFGKYESKNFKEVILSSNRCILLESGNHWWYENLYVGNNTLGIVQKFDRNGKFIESINIKDDIYMIKSEKDKIHVYAGKFDNIDYQILPDKIITKKISDQEMDNINSDKREKVAGNLWIHNGKIIFLKASLFPIDPEIIACIGIIMEGVMFIKKSRKSCI